MQPVSITPTSVHAEDYADIVSRTATMRKLIAAGTRIAELGYSDTDDLDATLRQAEDALYAVRNPTQQRTSSPSGTFSTATCRSSSRPCTTS